MNPVLKDSGLSRHFRYMVVKSLEEHTARHSNFQTKRNYISLSHIALDDDELLKQWFHGFDDSLKIRLKCYKGYQMERDLIARLQMIYGDRFTPGSLIELQAFDGLFKGHPDFSIDNILGDCKSVLLDEWLPEQGKLPRKVYWQMQAYMLYGKVDNSLVIYESRESGLLREYWLTPNKHVQDLIEQKVQRIGREIPSCA